MALNINVFRKSYCSWTKFFSHIRYTVYKHLHIYTPTHTHMHLHTVHTESKHGNFAWTTCFPIKFICCWYVFHTIIMFSTMHFVFRFCLQIVIIAYPKCRFFCWWEASCRWQWKALSHTLHVSDSSVGKKNKNQFYFIQVLFN